MIKINSLSIPPLTSPRRVSVSLLLQLCIRLTRNMNCSFLFIKTSLSITSFVDRLYEPTFNTLHDNIICGMLHNSYLNA